MLSSWWSDQLSSPFIFSAYPILGHSGFGAYSSCRRVRGGVHPVRVASLLYRDRQQFTFRFTPAAILQSPINVLMHALLESPIILTACMSLDCLSKPEYAERNRASTGRAWKLGFKPGPLLHCAGPNWLGGKKRLFCMILLSSKRKRLSSHIKRNHLELYCSSLKNNSVCYQTSYLLSFTEMYS